MTLQLRVFNWSKETFGGSTTTTKAIRGNKEMAELLSSLQNGMASRDVGEECADVAFFLLQICEQVGCDLIEEVEKKLVINRKRTWAIASDGSHQHVD